MLGGGGGGGGGANVEMVLELAPQALLNVVFALEFIFRYKYINFFEKRGKISQKS